MSLLRTLVALLLVIVLAGAPVVNVTAVTAVVTDHVAPTNVPSICTVEAVRRHFVWLNRKYRMGLAKYALLESDLRALAYVTVLGVALYGHPSGMLWAAAPAIPLVCKQRWTAYMPRWEGTDLETGIPYGPTIKFVNAGERPEDEIEKKVQWGEWSVREMYELAGLDYFVTLCENPKEILGLFTHISRRGLLAPDGNTWWPCWSSFGDKGCHVVFTREKMYPVAWLARLGFKAALNGKGDRFWKFMKRYRRLAAHPFKFAKMNVVSVQENWNDRAGWTMFTLVNPEIGTPFTLLVRPMIQNADGQSFCTAKAPRLAWGKKVRPLEMLSIGGGAFMGAFKGNMLVVTPKKQLPADFVISDPKNELLVDNRDIVYFTIQAECHRYTFARTDTQSVLHFGFEPFLPIWSKMYLDELRAALLNTEQASHMLGEVELDADGDPMGVDDTAWTLEKIACFYAQTKFQFNKIPYIFRLLVNTKIKGLRDLSANNDRNSVRIPLPKSLFTRRYIAIWEDVIDETGLETDPSTHILGNGECLINFGDGMYSGEIATWRQPNGFWTFNILKSVGAMDFVLLYGEDVYQWMAKSPALFVSAVDQAAMLEAWDGADFDDNVIAGRGDAILNHFRSLPPFPAEKPEVPATRNVVPDSFSWVWDDVMPFIKQAAAMKGIGYYCNRWMIWNYFQRLTLMFGSQYESLLSGVTAKVNLLGKGSEKIVDSHVKLGGVGLEWANDIVETFEKQLEHLSPFFVWTTSRGEVKSRMGKKVAGRIVASNGIVRLPIDDAVDAVRAHVDEFEAWADAQYGTLPNTWGLDPVLFSMDTYQPENMEKLSASANGIRAQYAAFFKTKVADRRPQHNAAQAWLNAHFAKATYKGTVGVQAILWQMIYHPDNFRTREDRSGRSRYDGEELIWGPGIIDSTLETLEGITKFATPAFPQQHQFTVTFDISRKMAEGKITQDQLCKWVAMGMKHYGVSLRPGTDRTDVFLPVAGRGEVLVGHINDRNALRCVLFNGGETVPATLSSRMLQDGTISANALLAEVTLGALQPQPPQACSRPNRQSWESVNALCVGGSYAAA